jgi:hypothetical protein
MERRMAFCFVLALALVAWQAWRTRPLAPAGFIRVNEAGDQLLPVGVPSWEPAPAVPAERDEHRRFVEEHSLRDAGEGAFASRPADPCRLHLRISSHHWLQRSVPPGFPAPAGTWFFSPEALFSDADSDGDPLDPGELRTAGPGAEAEVFCGPSPVRTYF